MEARRSPQAMLSTSLGWLHRAFDATADWVTQLSWWKFLIFAAVSLIAASIVQEELFSGADEEVVQQTSKKPKRGRGEANIQIDDSGIHFIPRNASAPPVLNPPSAPSVPEAPKGRELSPAHTENGSEVHIELPPQISEELSNAIEVAVEDAAEQKSNRYHKQASTWFKSFVSLLILALFGTKALMGGKKRAEAEMASATAAAERESMHRQLSEARMQMMQAQVEPHFLFNTLASVEYLIETDPPRASAMQRALIQYLRAVLPQMREASPESNLGREAEMVKAYLKLLKMRMEDRLTVDFDVPDGLRSAAFPPMMLQTLVENAIKHGLECKPEGGTLSVQAEVADSKLRVMVKDDGVGFGVNPSKGTGLGLTNTRERLKLLHGERASLSITPNVPSGVIATIEVPYQLASVDKNAKPMNN
ncbi:sensor histidine kinase [Massilia sp. TS11]|uniref:sensor histidine kinase n=1 Tax=Massilia sp. TS11 TaxID=2908003 RepID=UPI001EDBF7AF|nr:histidine kinase [Massilia sp. TS11]MCG2586196.1 histidine kinase [Massilia sp. TS11]